LRADDGISVHRGELSFASVEARTRFGASLKAIGRLRDCEIDDEVQFDFPVERRSGAACYTVAVRPLPAEQCETDAAALIFIHDPLNGDKSSAALLGQMFGLTAAEAEVAKALCRGLSPDEYARAKGVSANTVYTQIRRLKDKTDSRRMAELLRKLNDAQAAVVAKQLRDRHNGSGA
jgi:DNA-binding CsgD family transcriptional regulator